MEVITSLHPKPIGEIPTETARVARAAFPKGSLVTRLRDEFSVIYQDEDFGRLYPDRGQPALAPWRLALVTVFQFLENLSDRRAIFQAAAMAERAADWLHACQTAAGDPDTDPLEDEAPAVAAAPPALAAAA